MLLIKSCICFSYFIIGGLATTNILRLLKGNTLPVLSSKCHCDNCGMKINAFYQMPIISYIVSKGHCKECGIKLPVDALVLEFLIFIGMSLIAIVFKFSILSVLYSFVYYEIIRIVFIIKYGRREYGFVKQYCMALLGTSGFFLIVEFMALLLTTFNY